MRAGRAGDLGKSHCDCGAGGRHCGMGDCDGGNCGTGSDDDCTYGCGIVGGNCDCGFGGDNCK